MRIFKNNQYVEQFLTVLKGIPFYFCS